MAIEIRYKEAEGELFGMSKLWGCADLPHGCRYPEVEWVDEDGMTCADPMRFICQIRLQDIAAYDSENLFHTRECCTSLPTLITSWEIWRLTLLGWDNGTRTGTAFCMLPTQSTWIRTG